VVQIGDRGLKSSLEIPKLIVDLRMPNSISVADEDILEHSTLAAEPANPSRFGDVESLHHQQMPLARKFERRLAPASGSFADRPGDRR